VANSQKSALGGQAVIEGVMIRSERYCAVAVRRPEGGVSVMLRRLGSSENRIPFIRGIPALFSTLREGLSALHFSALEVMPEKEKESEGKLAIVSSLLIGFIFAFLFFGAVPHSVVAGVGRLLGVESLQDGRSLEFQVADGAVRLALFGLFLWAISKMKDIQRVFQYHGAEHQVVHAYEKGLDLREENLKEMPTAHARCGTSFLALIIVISIVLFACVFTFIPRIFTNEFLNHLAVLLIKVALVLPIASISYEVLKASSRGNVLFRIVAWPGLAFQRLTTAEPDASQRVVAKIALLMCLQAEDILGTGTEVIMRYNNDNEALGTAGAQA
jgi:uncharacterized protein YqhQ